MTDKEIIHKEVERLMNELIQEKEKGYGSDADDACILELQNVLTYIDSMQEKPVSTDILRKASEEYLKVLSETPYNNTPVTNAQTIIKELVRYLDNPSEYYPDHVTDVSKDLEEEIERYFTLWYDNEGGGCIKPDRWLNKLEDCMDIARHFAEWQKEQMLRESKMSGWVARDKDGSLHIFEVKPRRSADGHQWWDRDYQSTALKSSDFPDLKWEDKPVCVKLAIIKED